jgi:putative hydrolase of the HAD superfamily
MRGQGVNRIDGVLFDIGGVVTGSPLHALARYEREHGIAAQAISRAIVAAGEQGAWSRLERGELTVEAFHALFESDCRAAGLEVSGVDVMACIAEARAPRPRMLEAIGRLRGAGLRVGALTNNWRTERDSHPLGEHFDVVIESALVGLRKPDPRIYELACGKLGVAPARTAFLDDIGSNLKTARALGMATIKVDDPDAALRELGELVGLDLLG